MKNDPTSSVNLITNTNGNQFFASVLGWSSWGLFLFAIGTETPFFIRNTGHLFDMFSWLQTEKSLRFIWFLSALSMYLLYLTITKIPRPFAIGIFSACFFLFPFITFFQCLEYDEDAAIIGTLATFFVIFYLMPAIFALCYLRLDYLRNNKPFIQQKLGMLDVFIEIILFPFFIPVIITKFIIKCCKEKLKTLQSGIPSKSNLQGAILICVSFLSLGVLPFFLCLFFVLKSTSNK